jgi:hypothetical protein
MIKKISLTLKFKGIVNKYYELINIKNNGWTKNKLYNFSQIINIANLNLSWNKNITNKEIKNMIYIQNLMLSYNNKITDEGIKNMIHM